MHITTDEMNYVCLWQIVSKKTECYVKANIIKANIIKADIMKADIMKADIMKADIMKADIIKADIMKADIIKADIMKAYFFYFFSFDSASSYFRNSSHVCRTRLWCTSFICFWWLISSSRKCFHFNVSKLTS